MMTKIKADYEKYAELYEAFEIADEAGKGSIRKEYKELRNKIDAEGIAYKRMYMMYKSMMERGNSYIDIDSSRDADEIERTLATFKACGVDTFTVSGTVGSKPEYLWNFVQNGCTISGMAEINSPYPKVFEDGFEPTFAYILKVN